MSIILMIEYIGIASAALSGFLFAVKKECDWLGISVSAFLTALGGGVIRDILVDRDIYAFTHYLPVTVMMVMVIIAILLKLHRRAQIESRFVFIFTDALDMICFSIVGAMVAAAHGYNIFGIAIVAFCNGVGGGILRDILLNEVPWFMRTGLYGTISIGVGVLYCGLYASALATIPMILLLLAAGVCFRMLAYYRNWHMPMPR